MSPRKRTAYVLAPALVIALTHCASGPQPSPIFEPTAKVAAAPSRAKAAPARAHRAIMMTTACWFGGVWNDALDVKTPSPAERCRALLEDVYGSNDQARLERLRAIENVEVTELGERLVTLASDDPVDSKRSAALLALFFATADAQRETMLARRAADRVKMDLARGARDTKRPSDERDAVGPLSASDAVVRLLKLDAGDLTAEAHAVGILCAADRMEIARGLPKHLKVYAVEGVYRALFGVPQPDVAADGAESLKGGVWLAYLSDAAKAAGHSVPDRASTLPDRELMAWGGVVEGFSDRLRAERADVAQGTEERAVVDDVIKRLDAEYRASEAAVLAERAK